MIAWNRVLLFSVLGSWLLTLISGLPRRYPQIIAYHNDANKTNTEYFKLDTETMALRNFSSFPGASDHNIAANAIAGIVCRAFHDPEAGFATTKCDREDSSFFPSLPRRHNDYIIRGLISELNPYGDHLVWQEKRRGGLFVTNLRSNTSFLLIPSSEEVILFTVDWNNGIIYIVLDEYNRELLKFRIPKLSRTEAGIPMPVFARLPYVHDEIRGLVCRSGANETIYFIGWTSLYQATSDGSVVQLLSNLPELPSLGSLQYYDGFLYWFQGWKVGEIKSLIIYDILEGNLISKTMDLKDRGLSRVVIYEDNTERVPNGCEKLNCSHICIPYYKSQFQCVCPWGLLLVDGRQCTGTEIATLSNFGSSLSSSDIQLTWYDLGTGSRASQQLGCEEGSKKSAKKITWILTTTYFGTNETRCIANYSSNPDSDAPTYSFMLPFKSVPAYGSSLQENIHFFVNDTGCLQRLDLSTSTWWTLICLPGLGKGQIALDVDRWIMFWEDKGKSGFRTELMTKTTQNFTLFEPKTPRGREPSNLVALDSHGKKVYILSFGFLNVTSYSNAVLTIAYNTYNYDGNDYSNLVYSAGRLYWLEHFIASRNDYIVTFDPVYQVKERILVSQALLDFKVRPRNVEQIFNGCPQEHCSHFCGYIVPRGEPNCFCPAELPVLINASTCTSPPVLIATGNRINAEKMELTMVNSNPEAVTTFNFSQVLHDIHYAVLKLGNNTTVCKTIPTSSSTKIECESNSSNETMPIGPSSDYVQVLAAGSRDETLFFQSLSDYCIRLYSFRLKSSVKSACVRLPSNVSFVIDTRRHIIFWCDRNMVSYKELGAGDNKSKYLKPFTSTSECHGVTVNEYKAELVIIMNNTIILMEYSRFHFVEKQVTELHQVAYKYLKGLQYYADNIFWIGGQSQPGQFIESFAIRRNVWGKAVGYFNLQRIYHSKRAEQILRFQILESSSEEESWLSPCNSEPRKCDKFCLISDPLPPKQNHAVTCLPFKADEAPPDQEAEKDSAMGNNTFIIIICTFVAGCLMLTVVGVFFYLRPHQNQRERNKIQEAVADLFGERRGVTTSMASESVSLATLSMVIAPDEIRWDASKVIGRGNFGTVYRGRYNEMDVAVKTTKCTDNKKLNENLLADFIQELKVMGQIRHHKHVVMFYGAEVSGIYDGKVYAVLELSPIGSLKTYLHNLGGKGEYVEVLQDRQAEENEEEEANNEDGKECKMMLSWTRQIASGMLHLEKKNIVHGDLATRNILVFDEGRTVKLTDFGLSKNLHKSEYYTKVLKRPLPFRWSSIEILEKREFSTKADVWSYGVTVWEIFTLGALPYAECEWDSLFVTKLKEGMRLQKPNRDACRAYEKIMLPCWAIRGRDRPSFSAIEQACLSISKEKQDDLYIDVLCRQSDS